MGEILQRIVVTFFMIDEHRPGSKPDTGFGGGFAIPHCQSEQLQANTLAILKNRNGIEWGSLDGQPVHIVFLLAVRRQSQGKEHLKLLAKLSRLVMRDEFQARLRNAETSPATVDYILSCL